MMSSARGETTKSRAALSFQAGFEVTQFGMTQMLVRAF